MHHDDDYVLCECDLVPLTHLVLDLEERHAVHILKDPASCLTMIRAEDSLDKQEFFLGEALTTECEVSVDGAVGSGVCLGDEPVRSYCLAVLDAVLHNGAPPPPAVESFIEAQRGLIAARETEEFNLILSTHVDFKLMDQE
jgi:alpha-D-ribose 1-methylphosphonate 5-triphosphate synthase subunit PhnG